MTEEEVYAELTGLFRKLCGNPALVLASATTGEDIEGWDSIKMVSLFVAVEKRFGIELRSREVDELVTVGDLARLILLKRQ